MKNNSKQSSIDFPELLKGTQPFKGVYGAKLYVNAQGCKNRIC